MAKVSNWGVEELSLDNNTLKDLDMRSKLSSLYIGVTTNDNEVKKIFRALYEPIVLFGEGCYERRERLKKVLLYKYDRLFHEKDVELAIASSKEAKNLHEVLKMYNIDMSNVYNKKVLSSDYNYLSQHGEAGCDDGADRELFYTEGDESVRVFRKSIAHFSWKRILKRKAILHKYRNQCDKYEHKDDIEKFSNHLSQTLSLEFSQLAADRPLTMVKFSPNIKYIAASSYCSHIDLYDYTNHGYPLIQRLENDSKEMIHCIDWNFNSSYVYYDANEPDDIKDADLMLVSGGLGGTLSLWRPFGKSAHFDEIKENACINKLKIHESKINRILFHPCNSVIISSSADETIRLYDIERNKEIYIQEGHNHGVYALGVNGDGNLMASGDMHGVVLVFDLRTGKHIFQQQVHNGDVTAIDFHPLSAHIFSTASADNSVKIFDLRKFRPINSLLAHTKLVSDVQFEPIYGRYLATSSFDTHIKIWDTSDYVCRKVLSNGDTRVMGVHIAPDASAVIAAGYDRVWRLFKAHEDQNMYACFNLYKVLYN